MRIVEPESIRIDLDRFVARKVPVESKIVMVPMDGYIQVGETNILPDSLVVTGPRSLVNTINKIETEEKTYRNLVKPIHGTIPMVPPQWETVKYALHQVKFQTDIQRIGERTISDIRVQVIRLPKSMKATVVPSTLSLKLQGGVKLLSKIEKEDISAIIDFRTRNRYGSKKIPAIIKLPPEISLSEVRPEFFELVVEK
jgi:YbbR domain-containing protein